MAQFVVPAAVVAGGLLALRWLFKDVTSPPGANIGEQNAMDKLKLQEQIDKINEQLKKLKVSSETNIYDSSGDTYIINVIGDNSQPSIEIPKSNLPIEVDNQTPTQTPRGKSIDIKKTVHDHTYGKLIYKPIAKKAFPVLNYRTENIITDFDAAQERGQKKVVEHFTQKKDDEPLKTPHQLEDIGITILPERLKTFSGEINYLYGHEALSILSRYFTIKSQTALMPIRVEAYTDYDITLKVVDAKTITKNTIDENKFSLSSADLNKLYQGLGLEVLDRVKEPTVFIDKLLEKFGNAHFLQNDSKTVDAEPKYNPKSWGFNNLIEFYTSIIAATFWKSGLHHFPASVPKDMSNIPDFEKTLNAGIQERKLDEAYFSSKEKTNLYLEDENLDISKIEEGISQEFKEKYYQDIHSNSEFLSWMTRQIDALTGAFPIEIDIKDTDLIKVGDQGQRIVLPNIAETLAELTGQSITQGALIDALLNISLRNLQETGSTKIQAITSHYAIESIQDYLGFQLNKKEKEVQLTYNPYHGSNEKEDESLEKSLEPTKVKVAIDEYDDKESLEKHLARLLEAAAIIKAVHFRKVDSKDISGLKNMFLDAYKLMTGETDQADGKTDNNGKANIEDWDKFKDQFEQGFVSFAGVTDQSHPYKRNFERRPRVKEVGDVTD